MRLVDFVVVGFPKCGTTALVRLLDGIQGVKVHKMNGALEAPFFYSNRGVNSLRESINTAGDAINGHKFTAYIYNDDALHQIQKHNPNALFIVCIRDPVRALVSWREMHRKIAVAGTTTSHFVNKSPESRKFYQSCSLSDYYRAFAGSRLPYARYIRNFRETLNNPKLIIITQEYLAQNANYATHLIASHLGVEHPEGAANVSPHIGFADKVSDIDLDPELQSELETYRHDLSVLRDELHEQGDVTLLW